MKNWNYKHKDIDAKDLIIFKGLTNLNINNLLKF